MPRFDWTDEENDLIVKDYFKMLAKEIAGLPYKKSEHRQALKPFLDERSDGSIEFKHQNISAVLHRMGLRRIDGYKPARNAQASLTDAVVLHLQASPGLLDILDPAPFVADRSESAPAAGGQIEMSTAPTLSNRQPQKTDPFMRAAAKLDIAGRDERNRKLGLDGERAVVAHERRRLRDAGRDDLARRVRWVSQKDGDGAGYDIRSFCLRDGSERLLEVKTTGGWQWTPFYITRNELRVSEESRAQWRLFRLFNFPREPKAFRLHPPLENHVLLTATHYRASFEDQRSA